MERKIALEKIQKQVTSLENVINDVFARVSTDAMALMRNAEEITKLQSENAQIATLNQFLQVIAQNADVNFQMKMLLDRILSQRTNTSSCLATNAVEYYKFEGMRIAYSFLVETFKKTK
jgi:hypothetical protein